ncbi:MAG: PKD domain-containing protein [Bacteroidota bacterium]
MLKLYSKSFFIFLICICFTSEDLHAQLVANAGPDVFICPTGSVQLASPTPHTGGTGPFTYSWAPATNLSCTNCPNPISTTNITRTYTLTVTDASLPTPLVSTDQVTVTAATNPTSSFTFSGANNQCANLPINFTNTSTGATTFSWNFGDPASGVNNTSTLPNPSHVFTAVGGATQNFTVTLITTNAAGCQTTSTQTVTVRQTPGPDLIDPATGFRNCNGPTADFSLTTFDISANPTNSFFQIIWGDGTADFTGAAFPGGGVSHTYTTQEVFDLQYIVTSTNGCIDTALIPVANTSNPSIGVATLGGTTGCAPLNLCFPVSSFAGNHNTTIYLINYGDGSPIDTISHPPPNQFCHTYLISSCPGDYTFTIQAQNLCNTSQATVNPIEIYEPPIAVIGATPLVACVNTPVSFINNSNLGFNSSCSSFTTFTWTFDDGTGPVVVNSLTSTGMLHTFTNPGVYDVVLATSNSCGSSDDTIQVCIEAPPTPDFSVDVNTACIPFDVETNDLSVIANDCNTTRSWATQFMATSCTPFSGTSNFINGTTSTSLEPEFEFLSPGTFQIQQTLTNSCGNFVSTETIIAQAPPEIGINPVSSICGGQSITPTGIFNDCLESINTYLWNFPGGSVASSNAEIPGTISYAANGSYTITLTATNSCGSDVATTGLTVNDVPPVVNPFTVSPLCAGYDAIFTSDTVLNATYTWTGPNGFTSNLQNPIITNVTPADAGNYSVFASFGTCSGLSESVSLVILPITIVNAGNDVVNCIDDAPFTIVPVTPAGGVWSGNGINAAGLFTPSLAGAGPHTLTYTFTDPGTSCVYSDSITATVNALPIVDAGPDISLCNQPIANTLTPITPLNGTWSGAGVTNPTGEFTPSGIGVFEVFYSFTDGNGCFNEDTINITVIDPTNADAGLDSTICENGNNVQLTGLPLGGTWTGVGISPAGDYDPTVFGTFTMTYSFGSGTCQTSDEMDFIVNPAPTVDAGDDFTICLDGGTVDLSTSPTTTQGGTWTGTGITNPTGIFDPAIAGNGSHILTYSFTDPLTNCSNTDFLTATVSALPVVNAGNDTVLCNQPLAVQLPSSPPGGVWSGPNVTVDGLFTPSGTGVFELFYSFTLSSCDASDSMEVTVVDPSQADAGLDLEMCFSNTQTQIVGLPIGGTWSGTGIAGNGDYTPNVPGTYTLTYSFGGGNCLTIDDMELIVHDLPVVDAGSDAVFCESAGATNFIGSPANGNWTGTGITNGFFGTFDPSIAAIGINTLTYTFQDPVTTCINSDDIDVLINPLPNVSFAFNPIVCTGVTENFTNNTILGNTFSWNFGDNTALDAATNPTHAYANTGFFDINLIATTIDGCVDSLSQTIEVREAPTADFTLAPDSSCGPLIVNFTNNSTGIGALVFAWDFGNGNTSALQNPAAETYLAGIISDTNYFITLSVTNFCGTVSDNDSVKVMPLPVALFGPRFDIGCSPFILEFANNSVGLPDTYAWDFGNGTTSTISDSLFTQTFVTGLDDTTFTIKLIVTNECGVDSAFHTITVLPQSVNAFFNTNVTEGCAPLAVDFTNLSNGALQFAWDFGDLNVSSNADATNTYTQAGTYTVRMIANNDCSVDTAFATILVHPQPQIDFTFTPNSSCVGETFQFTNQSVDVANLMYDFGDLTQSNLSNPSHIYLSSGTFQVTLSGTSTLFACQASITKPVTVSTTPIANFTMNVNDVCDPSPVSFSNTSQNFAFTTWNFDDGNTSSLNNPTHTYTSPGTYDVELIVETAAGCSDTINQTVQIFPSPTADFNIALSNLCNVPVTATLDDNSTGATSYDWSFGNGTTSTLTNPSVTYPNPGIFDIKLVVSNQFNCFDSLTKTVNIDDIPVANFNIPAYDTCSPSVVSFVNTSINFTINSWSFGDGNVSNTQNPNNIYDVPGDYFVKLVVENNNACKDSVTQMVRVYPVPTADFLVFNADSCKIPAQVFTSNTSSGATNYSWNFGNSFTSVITNPSSFYDAAGTYFIKLVATNQYGCQDSIIKDVTIFAPPTANFIVSDQSMCVGEDFIATSLSLQEDSVRWFMGDGVEYTSNVVNHEYENAGDYFITLVAYGQGSCSDTMFATTPVTVNVTPIANFTYVNKEEEDLINGTIDFTNLSAFANTYLWRFEGDTTSTSVNPTYQFNYFGDVDVTLIAFNVNGCVDSITQPVVIDYFKGLHVPNAIFPGHPSFEVSHFLPKGVGLYSYQLTIYDDWGNLIYETSALDLYGRPTESWDGTFNGLPVQQDAYVWKIEATYMTSEFWEGKQYPDGKFKKSGTVTVIR